MPKVSKSDWHKMLATVPPRRGAEAVRQDEVMQTILGIDPGHTESGWVLLRAGRVLEYGTPSNDVLLQILRKNVLMPDVVAIESVACYGMAVGAEVFETVFWSGRFCEAHAYATRRDAIRIPRMAVKMHLCHDSRAKDPNIRQALIDLLGPAGTKKSPGPTYGISKHLWAALAVAVTATNGHVVEIREAKRC